MLSQIKCNYYNYSERVSSITDNKERFHYHTLLSHRHLCIFGVVISNNFFSVKNEPSAMSKGSCCSAQIWSSARNGAKKTPFNNHGGNFKNSNIFNNIHYFN